MEKKETNSQMINCMDEQLNEWHEKHYINNFCYTPQGRSHY